MNRVTKSFGSPLTSAAFLLSQELLSVSVFIGCETALTEKSFEQTVLPAVAFLSSLVLAEWVWEGRFLGQAFSVKPKLLSVLLCVWTKKLLGALIQYSVQHKVSDSHVRYMEGRRFYLSVCGLGRSGCQNKMTHFRSDALRAEELPANWSACLCECQSESCILHHSIFPAMANKSVLKKEKRRKSR